MTATGRTCIERRFIDKPVAQVAAPASDLAAGREPVQLIRSFVTLPDRCDHEVSILITIRDAAGR